jgi:SH3 domain protein
MKPARAFLLALLATPAGAATETAFVIDKLLVGVHKEEDLSSAIIKVLPTGTRLEVLARKGEIARVKDPEGASGWVDAAYLMAEPPAAAQLAQLKMDKQALSDRVKSLQAATAKSGEPVGKVDALTNENTELKSQLSAQKLRNGELEVELVTLRKRAAAASGAGGSVAAELQNANRRLTAELEEARRQVDTLRAQVPDTGVLAEVRRSGRTLSWPWLAGFVFLLAAGFGGGLYAMDYLNRRRHGGFRV